MSDLDLVERDVSKAFGFYLQSLRSGPDRFLRSEVAAHTLAEVPSDGYVESFAVETMGVDGGSEEAAK